MTAPRVETSADTPRPSSFGRSEFSTTDIAAAHDWSTTAYTAYEPRLQPVRRDFRFHVTHSDHGQFSLSRVEFMVRADVEVAPEGNLVLVQVIDGWYGIAHAHREVRAARGQALLLPYLHDETFTASWESVDTGVVTLRPAEVARIAAETTGIDPSELRFTGGLPVSPAADRLWRSTVAYVNQAVLPNPHAVASPLILAETNRLLAVTLLNAFDNTTMHIEPPRSVSTRTSPAGLRRALAYIEENAHSDLNLADIAAAARVGSRAVQSAFRQHLDTTPLAYARRVRLDGARRDLLAADPSQGDTVAEISAKWGFTHPGRFATAYHRAYGRSPSVDLRS